MEEQKMKYVEVIVTRERRRVGWSKGRIDEQIYGQRE